MDIGNSKGYQLCNKDALPRNQQKATTRYVILSDHLKDSTNPNPSEAGKNTEAQQQSLKHREDPLLSVTYGLLMYWLGQPGN